MTNEININIENGVKLLNEAVSNYEKGNMTAAYEKYQEAGKFLTEANNFANTEEGKTSMKYGWNKNFGAIYKVFENNTKGMLRNKSSKKQLSNIIKTIKENKVLKDEFSAYNAFTNPVNVGNTNNYVTESISLIAHYSPKTLKENNEKLINLFREYKLNENVVINDEEQELYENIEYLITNPKSFTNIAKYESIYNNLCDYVNENKIEIGEKMNLDEAYDALMNDVVDKYKTTLNEDEIKLIRDVTTNETKAKKLFFENKNKVIELIKKEALTENQEEKQEWETLLENINGKVYEPNTALANIAEFIELRNELEKD